MRSLGMRFVDIHQTFDQVFRLENGFQPPRPGEVVPAFERRFFQRSSSVRCRRASKSRPLEVCRCPPITHQDAAAKERTAEEA